MKKMPENWAPPVDAWQAEYSDEHQARVFATIGVQFRPLTDVSAFVDELKRSITSPSGPSLVNRAQYFDASGYENICFAAYWDNQTAFDEWWHGSGFHAYWDSDGRLTEAFGLWREIFAVEPSRFETLSSSRTPMGVAKLGKPFGDPVREHNYWGGMRDRVHAAGVDGDPLDSSIGEALPMPNLPASRGARMTVPVPDNFCLIRSGQDLSDCPLDEAATYFDVVHPHLVAGMAYLRDNPADTGCASCRFMSETDLDGMPVPKSFGLALFISMGHLEAWSHSHPSHLSIFASFFEMMKQCDGKLNLRLWHEVLVASKEASICEYVNCHPRTGLLPYFGQ